MLFCRVYPGCGLGFILGSNQLFATAPIHQTIFFTSKTVKSDQRVTISILSTMLGNLTRRTFTYYETWGQSYQTLFFFLFLIFAVKLECLLHIEENQLLEIDQGSLIGKN